MTTTQDTYPTREAVCERLTAQFARDFPGTRVSIAARKMSPVIVIDVIVVPQGQRRQGTGTRIMQAIIEAADANGITLACDPSTDLGGTKTGLMRFYRRFGFRPNKGRNADLSITGAMIRRPVTQ